MDFYVYSRQKAKRESYKINEPTLINAITDSLLNLNVFARNNNIVSICRLQSDDVTEENSRPGNVVMTEQDAIKIKDYVMVCKDEVMFIARLELHVLWE